MPAERHSGGSVVLGPCPGCELWQLEYTDEVAGEWALITNAGLDLSEWHGVVEFILQEHLAECWHLRRRIELGH